MIENLQRDKQIYKSESNYNKQVDFRPVAPSILFILDKWLS